MTVHDVSQLDVRRQVVSDTNMPNKPVGQDILVYVDALNVFHDVSPQCLLLI